ncbi:hypothetical protein DF109_07945 [Burkholderia stagnalis]|uniref:portal protein n=1 Tax=Burkholderia stagnalis TaxID=1503054 RepID=UPI000F5D170D|nr:hypothetical protein [Burkholderia stagnalis]RQY67270.1 hypothetical protein DF109_07945 [Burkholderia stagnalis]
MADSMTAAPAAVVDVQVAEYHVPDVSVLCRRFEEAEDMTYDARKRSERDRDYYDGQQWTRAELDALAKRGQPALTINYVKRKVEYLRGFERRMRSDPKAFPRTPHEDQLAEASTDSLRYVADQNDFDVTRSDVYEDMLIEGYGGADVTVIEGPDGYDVDITRIPWDRIWFDPYSRQKDFSDARYLGVVIWMDRDEALDMFPDRQDAIEYTLASVSVSDTYDDRPKYLRWADNRRTRVRVVQCHWVQDGVWFIATFTKGGYLTDPMPSPYIGRDGKPACSLILRSAYVDRENQRYGHVRDMISLQDEVNKRRSKALHLMSVRQTFGNAQAINDVDAAKRQLARPDGHLEVQAAGKFGEDFGILPTGDMAASQMQLMQHATAELQASGPNAAMAGKDPRIQSGRAIQAQQAGGAIEVEPIIDDLRQWTKQIYEATWLRIRQFWTSEKWIRVTDDEKNTRWVGLNRQVTVADALGELPPDEAQALMQQMGLQPGDPRLNEVVRVDNDIGGLDVDITIEEGPDVANVQAEQFQMLAQLAPALAQAGDPLPPEVLIEASQLRNKDKLLEMLEQGRAARAPAQQQAQQLGTAQQQANIEKTNAQANKANAEAARTAAEAGQPDGAAPDTPQGPSSLDQMEQAAKIRKLDAETGKIQTEAVRNIADAQRPPMVTDFA